MTALSLANLLLEGGGVPGKDVPAGYLVQFHFNGHSYSVPVETSAISSAEKHIAERKAMCSVFNSLGIDPKDYGYNIAIVRSNRSLNTVDYSDYLGTKYCNRYIRLKTSSHAQ
jgi:hypothetical protein